jgi:hypothetical protein
MAKAVEDLDSIRRAFEESATVAASPKADKARDKLITAAYNAVTGYGDIATPEDILGALNRLYDAATLAAQPVLDEQKEAGQ